jgi:hypothetical protein
MRLGRVLILILPVVVLTAGAAAQPVFDLQVERIRIPRNQPGDLQIDAQGIRFQSHDGKTKITIAIEDLRQADVADPHSLRFEAYGRRGYTFRAAADAPVEEIAQFLAAHVYRPVVGHYASASRFQVPAFHRHTRGGTNGTLEIGEEAIRFVSDKPADSRTWLYRDIETIGRPDPFRFRVTTNRETYVVELTAELPEAAYQFAWSKVYNLEAR